jgi:hypothetical protein
MAQILRKLAGKGKCRRKSLDTGGVVARMERSAIRGRRATREIIVTAARDVKHPQRAFTTFLSRPRRTESNCPGLRFAPAGLRWLKLLATGAIVDGGKSM